MAVSTTPLYSRIQEMLCTRIAPGRLAAGQRLAPETELAKSFEPFCGIP
jgi:DNA-binding GntR family transcriptional regulator